MGQDEAQCKRQGQAQPAGVPFPKLAPQGLAERGPPQTGWAGNEDDGDEEDGDGWEDEGDDGEDGGGNLFMGVGKGDGRVDEGEGAVIRGHFPETGADCSYGSTGLVISSGTGMWEMRRELTG